MVNPQMDCSISMDHHSTIRHLQRGLAEADLDRVVRQGTWKAEGENRFDCVYGRWHLKVMVGRCILKVITAFKG
jgi:hypothetical protein